MTLRPLTISATLLFALARGATVQQPIAPHATNEIVMDSRGSMMRREERTRQNIKWKTAEALLAENAVGTAKSYAKAKQPDLYVLVGRNKCNGGGFWKRYELTEVTPGRYEYCAAACDAKDECVGFDVGNVGCNLYTQKAVAMGTWPSVRYLNGEAFEGEGDHDKFPETPFDLEVGTDPVPEGENFQCYRKTFYKPVSSYYWLIGHGTCSGDGGLWKRYVMTPGNYDTCSHACNLRDECIGFDVGTWEVSDKSTQVYQDKFKTDVLTTTGCFMYTQKAVYGTWPAVQDITAQDGEGKHDTFPPTPFDLTIGYRAKYEVGKKTKCWGKTHWVGLDSYYMNLGHQLCNGGGSWKHYKMNGATLDQCKSKCDEKDACVGLDFEEGKECRLFTHIPVAYEAWEGVTFGAHGAFAGEGAHNKEAPTPFSLIPGTDTPTHSRTCLAKTHFETPQQALSDNDDR